MKDRYERYSRGGIGRSRNLEVIIMTLSLSYFPLEILVLLISYNIYTASCRNLGHYFTFKPILYDIFGCRLQECNLK